MGNFFFFFPLKFHPFVTMRKIKKYSEENLFFLLHQFLSFFSFFFYLSQIDFRFRSVLSLTKETKNLKLKATKFKHLTQSQGSIFFF